MKKPGTKDMKFYGHTQKSQKTQKDHAARYFCDFSETIKKEIKEILSVVVAPDTD